MPAEVGESRERMWKWHTETPTVLYLLSDIWQIMKSSVFIVLKSLNFNIMGYFVYIYEIEYSKL